MKVGIVRSSVEEIEERLNQLLELIEYRCEKERVFIKPNIVVNSPPQSGVITHPKVVEGLVRYFVERGKEVVIGEGTAIFSGEAEFERLIQGTGYGYLSGKYGVEISNLELVEREEYPWKYGKICIPKILKSHEYVNVPSMKTHSQTLVTLGVKNQKGLLLVKDKKRFHKKGLHDHILELGNVIRPDLTVIDGIYCIEGNGPTGYPMGGETKEFGVLVAGQDMMEVDNVCVEIMGFNVRDVRHLTPRENIEIKGVPLDEVKTKFEPPERTVRVGNFTIHFNDLACTLCTVSFSRALSKILFTPELLGELNARDDLKHIDIIMGGAEPTEELGTTTICLGNCSKKLANKRGFPLISGCHPDYKDLIDHLFNGYYRKKGAQKKRP